MSKGAEQALDGSLCTSQTRPKQSNDALTRKKDSSK